MASSSMPSLEVPKNGILSTMGKPLKTTLPKTNMAPENRALEKEIPIGNHHF